MPDLFHSLPWFVGSNGILLAAAIFDGYEHFAVLVVWCFVLYTGGWVVDRVWSRRVRSAVSRFAPSDIASARGETAVEGRIVADRSLESSVRGERCVAYRCRIWWGSGQNGQLLADVAGAVPFRMRDDSGWALVRPDEPQLLPAWRTPAAVPAELMPRVSSILRKADSDTGNWLPRGARKALAPTFTNSRGRLRFEEYYLFAGDQAVVLGEAHRAHDPCLAEIGVPMSYRTAPVATRIGPAPAQGGVWIASGTHEQLMAELEPGNRRLRDCAAL
ncbi:MAG: hypothetical protein JRI23_11920 [Deltaproteobacteria bacterium]|nr:hypothetical protein [Deltaproteobacteria bacterium]MBW2532415.1 hypothetical protein [Deltaproteobacteria bacterium]